MFMNVVASDVWMGIQKGLFCDGIWLHELSPDNPRIVSLDLVDSRTVVFSASNIPPSQASASRSKWGSWEMISSFHKVVFNLRELAMIPSHLLFLFLFEYAVICCSG